MSKKRPPYPYVHSYEDPHGKPRVYFRRGREKAIALPWPIGTREFIEAYQAAVASAPELEPVGIRRTKPGSISALVVAYYSSPEWATLSQSSQRRYRNILEHFRGQHGDKPVALIRREHVKAMIGAKAATPAAANKLRKRLRVLMRFAVDRGWRDDNPADAVHGIKIKSDGYRTWTEDHIAQFEARHPVGSKARLALDLLLYTGQRRGDVVGLGRQHAKGNVLTVKQQKTGAIVVVPIHPALRQSLDATPSDHLTFLVTEYGRPFTPAGFGNWFRDRCNEAGLRGVSAHGLRQCAGVSPRRDAARVRSWRSQATKLFPRSRATPRRPIAPGSPKVQ